MGIRGAFGFPVLRKPLMQFAEQMRDIQHFSPEQAQALQQQLESRQPQPTVEEVRRQPSACREILPPPRLPLRVGLKGCIEKLRVTPIRRGRGEVLHFYSEYISSPRQTKH